MTTTPKTPRKVASKRASAAKESPAALIVEMRRGDDQEAAFAKLMARPEVRAASVIQKLEGDQLNINKVAEELRGQVAEVHQGSMGRAEAMLTAQAHSLDALFSNLARRSIANMESGYGESAERYMRLALRAQNQCRTTLEALSAIKNPPVVFAKQMNVAHGPQQVNNGVPMAKDITHTSQTENAPNELGGSPYELLPNTGTPGSVGGTVPAEKAVVEIDRAKD